jgi:hypothetical protein
VASISATEARKRLYALIDEVGDTHEPVQITGKRGNAVLPQLPGVQGHRCWLVCCPGNNS